jgi:hypothetical protein
MTLHEHLLIFICKGVPLDSTKDDIDIKLFEFLFNLKFYSFKWPRARLFS